MVDIYIGKNLCMPDRTWVYLRRKIKFYCLFAFYRTPQTLTDKFKRTAFFLALIIHYRANHTKKDNSVILYYGAEFLDILQSDWTYTKRVIWLFMKSKVCLHPNSRYSKALQVHVNGEPVRTDVRIFAKMVEF